ncbi:hypothetical protein [Streptomyces sioyaensis]|uniref:hypothetical protein n=1 Tax=Streptomyces sioyaensis TaxID=67364 RepID=UPI003556A9DE
MRRTVLIDAPSNLGLRPPAPGVVPGCYKQSVPPPERAWHRSPGGDSPTSPTSTGWRPTSATRT